MEVREWEMDELVLGGSLTAADMTNVLPKASGRAPETARKGFLRAEACQRLDRSKAIAWAQPFFDSREPKATSRQKRKLFGVAPWLSHTLTNTGRVSLSRIRIFTECSGAWSVLIMQSMMTLPKRNRTDPLESSVAILIFFLWDSSYEALI
ncbi:hypothetical protein VTN96DRAFT_10055 [Rasamsonia emersonii]